MVTIRDVAERAGVSTTTVSHALNGTRFVNPEKAARIFSAARELGYTPNPAARVLRTGATRIIGALGPSSLDPFFAEAIDGIEDVCSSRGYDLLLGYAQYAVGTIWGKTDVERSAEVEFLRAVMDGKSDALHPSGAQLASAPSREMSKVSRFLARGAKGLILNLYQPDDVVLKVLQGASAKIALFHRRIEGLEADRFGSDDYGGTMQAMEALLALGHRRIGMIYAYSQPGHGVRARFLAYRDALQKRGIEVDLTLLLNGGHSPAVAATATETLLALADPPTAILYWGDGMALPGMDAARRAGRSIPQDLSIVGFDDLPFASLISPRLSTIRQEVVGLGAVAAARLIDRIEGKIQGPAETVSLPMRFVARESTGPAPGR
ncbi:MAG TPA: LacI family DNA-binding transcriptional regulator [Spirochaetia bacterium]|nr:LacI family DNA-binding transcriptional regulator [Spirochaetia bacterium]